jgi:flagellar hook-length control protein FliK
MSIAFPSPTASTVPANGPAGVPLPALETNAVGTANGAAAAANPFSDLLAGLEALQQPMVAADLPANETAAMLAPTVPPTIDITETNVVFMGPAFNSRLALAQTDQLAQPVSAPPLASLDAAPLADTPISLLNLLTGKFKTQAVDVEATPAAAEAAPSTDADAPLDVAVDISAMLLPPTLAPADGSSAVVETLTSDIEETIANEVIAVPTLAAPKPLITDLAATEPSDTTEASREAEPGGARISLFDKLSGAAASKVETPNVDVTAAADASVDAAAIVPVAAAETKITSGTTSVVPLQSAETDFASATPAPSPPTVTMRPNTPAQLVDGVSVLVARAGKSAINEFVIRIDPPELGRIDVQLKMHEDGSVQAVIASDNVSTYDLLRREASTIERALADSGLRTGNDGLSFNLKQQGGENPRSPHAQASAVGNSSDQLDEPLPAAILTPLRQRYENARVNISA